MDIHVVMDCQLPETKAVKNRVHLDVVGADIDSEGKRLAELGATYMPGGTHEEHGTAWLTMTDPEGDELCVCRGWE